MGKPLCVSNLSCIYQQGTRMVKCPFSLGNLSSASDPVLLSSHFPVASGTQCSLVLRINGDNNSQVWASILPVKV